MHLGLVINMRTFQKWEISRPINGFIIKKLILSAQSLWCSTNFCQIKSSDDKCSKNLVISYKTKTMASFTTTGPEVIMLKTKTMIQG
jgi:ethanolamine utilization protein EutQ (cupin superfamily)